MSSPSTQPQGKHQLIDRRASVRRLQPPGTTGQVTVGKPGRPYRAMVHDISQTGIGLVLLEAIEPGTAIAVELQSPDNSFLYSFEARVAHSTKLAHGGFLVGCAFVRELTEAEYRNLP